MMTEKSEKSERENADWGVWKRYYIVNSLTEKAFSKLGYSADNLENALKDSDIIIPECSNCTERGMKNFYELYINTGRKDLLDHIIEYMLELYPDYKEASEIVKNSVKGYHCNIFLMKAEIYDEYCSWLFSILNYIYEEYKAGYINPGESRFIGYYAEYLTGIFYVKSQMDGKRVVEYPAVFFRYCDGQAHSFNTFFRNCGYKIYRMMIPQGSRREKYIYSFKDKIINPETNWL